jgi:hypothetical protein
LALATGVALLATGVALTAAGAAFAFIPCVVAGAGVGAAIRAAGVGAAALDGAASVGASGALSFRRKMTVASAPPQLGLR